MYHLIRIEMMKLLIILILFLILIKEIDSKKWIRRYVLIRDEELDKKGLSQYSILNWNEKEYLYRLKTSYADDDEIILINYPDENQIGYLNGQWKNETVNTTFELFHFDENQWKNGSIEKIFNLFIEKYLIKWNDQLFYLKKILFSDRWKFVNSNGNEFAHFEMRFRWIPWSSVKYHLKISSENLPDQILFFVFLIQDHRAILL